MKVLVIIEHDNETVKQSSFSTITAAKEISCLLYTSDAADDC